MCRIIWVSVLLVGCLVRSSTYAAPANSLRELWQAIEVCSRVELGSTASEMTVLFSLKRDGSLLGKPRITYSKLYGDREEQLNFVASVLRALGKCFPLSISDGLGGAIAGRPLSIHFRGGLPPARI